MVTAGIATIPERVAQLQQAVESLLPQVDRLGVCLNGHAEIPAFLNDDKIEVRLEEGHGLGAYGKFAWVKNGYYLSCDDDFVYPPDYVDSLLAPIEAHKRRAVVSHLGAIIGGGKFRCGWARPGGYQRQEPGEERYAHVLGTGLMGFHTSAITIPEFAGMNNAVDATIARVAQEQSVPMLVVAHDYGCPTPIKTKRGIYTETRRRTGSHMDHAELKREMLEGITWQIFQ